MRQQVEAGIILRPGRPSQVGLRHVLDHGPRRLLERPGNLDRDGLDLGVVPLLVLRVVARNDQGVGEERDLAGTDQFRFALKDRQGILPAGGERPSGDP